MSAPTTFKPSIRDAGELTEQRIYGSFRSLHRFEAAPAHKSKHDDIFKSKEYESSLPPKAVAAVATACNPENQEKTNADETTGKKSSSKEKSHRTRRSDDGRRSKNRIKREDKPKEETRDKENKQKERDQENKDDEFIKYLGERHERRRKKQPTNEEPTPATSPNEKENQPDLHSSFMLRKTTNSSRERLHKPESTTDQDRAELQKLEKQKFITRPNAFSAGSKSEETSSDLEDNNLNKNNADEDIKVDILRQHFRAEPVIVNQDCDFFKSIKNFQTAEFILTPAPQGQTVNCKILCRRGIISEYLFLLEQANTANILLMKTHRKMATAKATHFIDIVNYNEAGLKASNEISCAKVSSNMARKKFKLNIDNNNFPLVENNILNVIFKSHSGEPRKVIATACLMAGTSGSKEKVTYVLKNRPPHFDINMRKFVLNYNGRAKQSSKNNFQIFDESFPDEILMQLGKVETGEYNCDYTWPLCAMQAFGLAISSLSR